MKKILIGTVFLSIVFIGSAFAAETAQNNTGCGFGAYVAKDNKMADDTLVIQLGMTTLNRFSLDTFLQSSAVTSGTSECKKPSKVVENKRLQEFIVANMDNLAKDIARGQGESLEALTELMGISADEKAMVHAKLQSNFSNIFTSENIEVASVVDNIITVIVG